MLVGAWSVSCLGVTLLLEGRVFRVFLWLLTPVKPFMSVYVEVPVRKSLNSEGGGGEVRPFLLALFRV